MENELIECLKELTKELREIKAVLNNISNSFWMKYGVFGHYQQPETKQTCTCHLKGKTTADCICPIHG